MPDDASGLLEDPAFCQEGKGPCPDSGPIRFSFFFTEKQEEDRTFPGSGLLFSSAVYPVSVYLEYFF